MFRILIPSLTRIALWLIVVVPIAALIVVNFDEGVSRVATLLAVATAAYAAVVLLLPRGDAPRLPGDDLSRVTLGKVLLGLVLAAIIGVALCYWPEQPPNQEFGSDWFSLGTMPTMLVLLAAHPFETGAYVLLVGYMSAGGLLALRKTKTNIPPRYEQARRAAPIVLAINAIMLVVALVGFSRTSADRIWAVKSKAQIRQ